MYQKRKISIMLLVILILQIAFPIISVVIESALTSKSIAYDGTEYYINTAQDMWDFAQLVNNGDTFKDVTVYLTADIDLGCSESKQWIPIGNNSSSSSYKFEGIFDGQNHIIRGIYITEKNDTNKGYIGLFGNNVGTIRNLVVSNSSIVISNVENRHYIGMICAYNSGDIINCVNNSNISITDGEDISFFYLGGIVGYNYNGRLIGCTNSGTIETVTSQAGGIIGYSRKGEIYNCKNFGTINSTYSENSVGSLVGVGGIVGVSGNGVDRISNCLNEGNIEGKNSIGGIAGSVDINNNWYEESINIMHCSNKGKITGYQCVGGIIGKYEDFNLNENINSIYACCNYGEVKSSMYAGGIIGDAGFISTIINECFNTGKISGSHHLGGICGIADYSSTDECHSSIINCYNRGNIECGYHIAGGLIGSSGIELKNGYTTGDITGSTNECGLVVGHTSVKSIINNIYYIPKGGEINACGKNYGELEVLPKTEGEMKNQGVFVNQLGSAFIQDSKNINEGYPILKWQNNELVGISIIKEPDKVNYVEGQNFDEIGMVVTATYKDGSIKEITDFIIINGNDLLTTQTNISIMYTENGVTKTQTQAITVVTKKLIEIAVTTPPTRTNYIPGQNFERTGMVVTAFYNDGNSKQVTDYLVTNGDNLQEGKTSVTISYTENDVTKITTQEISVNKYLARISISKIPTKTSYIEGQIFDCDGMIVKAIYHDGSNKTITNYTVTDGDNLQLGKTSVTISYTENGITKTTTQNITVVAKALTGIAVTTAPTRTSYVAGQNFETAGMVVTASYNDGSSKAVTGYTVTDGNSLTAGKTNVTISYTENGITKTATQNITVVAKALTGIAITKAPTRTNYVAGQSFSTSGMVVTASYNDGTSKAVTGYTVTDGTNLLAGKTSVTISYTENGVTKTVAQTITVVAKALTEIAITKAPTKTNYVAGQSFSTSGMVITASYNDGSSQLVTNYTVTDGNSLTAGKTSVTISYTEGNVTKTTVQNITVSEKLSIETHDLEKVEKDGKTYIESINPGATVKSLTEKIDTNGTVEIFKGTEKVTNVNTKLATGMTLKISLNNEQIEHTIVVTGDLNGDGEMGDIDVLRLARYRAGLDKNLTGAYLQASNIFKDDNYADDIDLLKIVRILVGLDSLTK